MTKRIFKKILLAFFVTLFLLYSLEITQQDHVLAVDYDLSNSWDGDTLDFSPQLSIDYVSSYRYFSEIIDSLSTIDPSKTYVIETAYDLYMLSVRSNGIDRLAYLDLNYVLGNDIDYYQIVQENVNQRFMPIGFIDPFTGTFDGQGFEITNLYFDSIMTDEDYQTNYSGLRYVSMFSRISAEAEVKNVGLINPIIIQPIEWGIMNYVSALVGENYGTVQNVYLIDNRDDVSGFNAEGAFHLSGLVSINYGTFSNSFVSTKHIKSNAVVDNDSTSVILYANSGVISHLYYDSQIYADVNADTSFAIGLLTNEFQNHTLFDSGWYFNDQYQSLATTEAETIQYTLKNDYPILQGLNIINGKLAIDSAEDLLYMNELLRVSGMFRLSTFTLTHDIDMKSVAYDAYQAANVGFNGTLTSEQLTPETALYERTVSQGGDLQHHTILNLSIHYGTAVGNFTSYALFASFFGTISYLNIANMVVEPYDLDDQTVKSKLLISTLAGQANDGQIDHVYVDATLTVPHSNLVLPVIYEGGLVAEGKANLSHVSSHGLLSNVTQIDDVSNSESAVGGLIGHSQYSHISQAYQAMNLIGLSYESSNASTLYLGGAIGFGSIDSISEIVTTGSLLTNDDLGVVGTLYVGGIIGNLLDQTGEIHQLYNHMTLDVRLAQPLTLYLSGIMNVDGSGANENTNFIGYSMTNQGSLTLTYPGAGSFSIGELNATDIHIAGVMQINNVIGSYYGLFNQVSYTFDLSLIQEFAGILSVRGLSTIDLQQAYQTGNMTLESQNDLTQTEIKIAGVATGSGYSLNEIRNEGNLLVVINDDTRQTSTNLYVNGLFDTISQTHTFLNGYQGGDISVYQQMGSTVDLNVFVSGIGYLNGNTDYYSANQIIYDDIDQKPKQIGPIDNVLNDGDLLVSGSFNGNIISSGLIAINQSMLSNAINLGSVVNQVTAMGSMNLIDASGLIYLMDGPYAELVNGANQGHIEALSLSSTYGYANASGLVSRNDLNPDFTMIGASATNQLAKIWFSINYGDIFAFSQIDETTGYDIASETHSKAAGIFGNGLLSIIDAINYGNVYSKYVAAGIIGTLDLYPFQTYDANQVYMANTINYGKIRAISSYDTTYHVDMSSVPARAIYNAFGSTIGKIQTDSLTWEFLSYSSYDFRPIDYIAFGYMLNFDTLSNMVGNAPEVTLEATIATNGIGNDVLMAQISKFMTTNPNDDSKAPFNLFFIEVPPKGSYYGKHITSFDMSEEATGIFSPDFLFRNLPVSYSGTNQYLKGYFSYVALDKTNDLLISKLESDQTETYLGLYVLSSSYGISNGIFIPDQFDLDALSPHETGVVSSIDWLGSIDDETSSLYALQKTMRQIEASYATAIYDLEIKQVDSNGDPIQDGLVLTKPMIDEARGLITYYLPSNATLLSGTTVTNMSTYSYIEASEGIGRKVPNLYENGSWFYKWVGHYKKSGQDYIEIGPYNSTGIYDVTYNTSVSNDKSAQNSDIIDNTTYTKLTITDPSSILTSVYVHLPHVKQVINNNYWWEQTGLYVNSVSAVNAGYGAYKLINYQQPPIYSAVYQYVGASEELVTYERTSSTTTPVFNDAGIYFDVNFDQSTYSIAQGASLTYNDQALHTISSVPQSYGVYDVLIDSLTDTYIDSVTDHYGSIRVYSHDYDPLIPASYRDYDIRIIRTADQNLTGISELMVDGIDALSSYTDFHDVSASVNLNYEKSGDLGVLSVTYQTNNLANGTSLLPWVTVIDVDTGLTLDPSLYHLSKGLVENTNTFNNADGTFGYGSVTIDLEVTDYMPSGDYQLVLNLLSEEVAVIHFNKIESSNANVESLIFNQEEIAPQSDVLDSVIPYGINYSVSDSTTDIVNFTNLSTLSNLYYTNLESGQIPSYLTQLSISPFATLLGVDLSISMLDSYRHTYTITYHLEAEDGTLNTFTHVLTEAVMTSSPSHVYLNGGDVSSISPYIEIGYLDSPTLRVEFDFNDIYDATYDALTIQSVFVPDNPSDTALPDVDYFIRTLDDIGYEVDFNREISIGYYTFNLSFERSVSLWGETLTWSYDFDDIVIRKIKNDDSKLENIMFVSDTIYSGFNTIVDDVLVDETTYTTYIENPDLRPITVLPTTGIYYGDHDSSTTYWIIGQVQKTNLSYYLPTFVLPDGAIIRRVINTQEIDPIYQSENLVADFSPYSDAFNYVLYRVYAHDYSENPTHYTDYYVAVQDVTNNIRFNLEVINNSNQMIHDVYVEINVSQTTEPILSMTGRAIFDPLTHTYSTNKFQTTIYGTYALHIDLPQGVTYTLTLQNEAVDGSSFYLENSLLPRKYFVVVTLIDDLSQVPWGIEETLINLKVPEIDPMIIYGSGSYFTYDNQVYQVQDGYSYQYNASSLPGSSPDLGLRLANHFYDLESTYLVGDYVFYQGAYYQALLDNTLGIEPDSVGISSGYWVLLP